MNAGATEEETNESIPSQLGRRAKESIDKAHAQASLTLAKLESKTNGVIDQVQDKLNLFMDKVYTTKQKIVTGIDTAIGLIETPLLALAPILREVADTGIAVVFGAVEPIPELVQGQIKDMKDPLVEQIQGQVDTIAKAATEQISAVEEKLGGIKDKLITMADDAIGGLTEKVDVLVEEVPAQFDKVIQVMKDKFAQAWKDKPGYEDIEGQLDETFNDLKDSAVKLLERVLTQSKETILELKEQAKSAINITFDELFATIKKLPEQVATTVNGIVKKIDGAFEATLTDARMMAEGLLADLRKRLKDTSMLISGTIEDIVNDGFALIRDARKRLVGSINNLIETVRSFAQGTLDKIKDASNDMFRTSREAVELGFAKVNEGIVLAVEDLGSDLNQQINNTQDKMKREAEKQARELKVMGEEAFAEAEQDFVDNGYEEDTSVIPDIRAKGEEAIEKIETSMKESADKLKA
ncbi:MAG: ElaB/YqjD/DUF883 family membrane-anchored ribosome-binding protein, partial [Bradymonadia bacterium]